MDKQKNDKNKNTLDKGDEDMENITTKYDNEILTGLDNAIKEMRLMKKGLKKKRTLGDLLDKLEKELDESDM